MKRERREVYPAPAPYPHITDIKDIKTDVRELTNSETGRREEASGPMVGRREACMRRGVSLREKGRLFAQKPLVSP